MNEYFNNLLVYISRACIGLKYTEKKLLATEIQIGLHWAFSRLQLYLMSRGLTAKPKGLTAKPVLNIMAKTSSLFSLSLGTKITGLCLETG